MPSPQTVPAAATAVRFLYAAGAGLPSAGPEAAGAALPEAEARVIRAALVRQGADQAQAEALLSELAAGAAAAAEVIAAGEASPLSAEAYDAARAAWLTAHGMSARSGLRTWPPTSQTVRALLGAQYWNDAMTAVGLPASGRGRQRGNTRFSAADYAQAMRDFLAAAGSSAPFAAYAPWAKDEASAGRPRPSGAAVRKQFGSWSAAKAAGAPR